MSVVQVLLHLFTILHLKDIAHNIYSKISSGNKYSVVFLSLYIDTFDGLFPLIVPAHILPVQVNY